MYKQLRCQAKMTYVASVHLHTPLARTDHPAPPNCENRRTLTLALSPEGEESWRGLHHSFLLLSRCSLYTRGSRVCGEAKVCMTAHGHTCIRSNSPLPPSSSPPPCFLGPQQTETPSKPRALFTWRKFAYKITGNRCLQGCNALARQARPCHG